MAIIIDGRKVSQILLNSLKKKKGSLGEIRLVVIMVGKNPASLSYILQKEKACRQIGISYKQINYDENITTEAIIAKIKELNTNREVTGMIVQLPLPKHLETSLIIKAIDPKKDVDGFTAYNLGKMFLSKDFEHLPPATPAGIIKLLEHYNIKIEGREITVVGHSNIVGKPISMMLLNRNATVTTCHIHTKNLGEHTKRADILISATGKIGLIKKDMVKQNAVVIDVGCSKGKDGRFYGDVDTEKVKETAGFITPVPGGVGPMTVACLIENLVTAAERMNKE